MVSLLQAQDGDFFVLAGRGRRWAGLLLHGGRSPGCGGCQRAHRQSHMTSQKRTPRTFDRWTWHFRGLMVIWTWLQSGVCGKIWWNYIPLVNFEATFWLQDGAEEQMTQSWPMRHPPRRREQMIGFSPILKSMFHGLTMDQHVEAMSRQPKAKNWWFALYVCCHVCRIPLVYHLYFLNIWPFGLPSLTPHIFTLVRMISRKPTYYNYTFHYWLMVMQCWIEPSTGFSYGKHHGLTWFTLILKAEQTDTFFQDLRGLLKEMVHASIRMLDSFR